MRRPHLKKALLSTSSFVLFLFLACMNRARKGQAGSKTLDLSGIPPDAFGKSAHLASTDGNAMLPE
jgi:hypothetical protein